ncbi:hypothetical protein [Hymenobacter psoromatis]|uniref:hypothetical protein n=1 Tax=Hymenobacter psoromatis TaxID=1484116 RepID=UPI001CBC9F55|nr:hypothetical protein [Hymenobacter psoromatis]
MVFRRFPLIPDDYSRLFCPWGVNGGGLDALPGVRDQPGGRRRNGHLPGAHRPLPTPNNLAQVRQRIAAGRPLNILEEFYTQLLATIRADRLRRPWWKLW